MKLASEVASCTRLQPSEFISLQDSADFVSPGLGAACVPAGALWGGVHWAALLVSGISWVQIRATRHGSSLLVSRVSGFGSLYFAMPWKCVKCGDPTYRRDRVCKSCRESRLGLNNKLFAKQRLRTKTSPSESSGKFHFRKKGKAAPGPGNEVDRANVQEAGKESMAEALESRRDVFRQIFSNDADYHSAMAVAHAIMQRISSNSGTLLQTSRPNLCGLVSFAMTLSARLTDDQVDVYSELMLKVMSVSSKDMRCSECHWVSLYHDCGDNRDIPVLGD